MRILRTSDRITKAWKNGGGTTQEIMVSPIGAGYDDFDWRLSMADIGSSGPFSSFTNVTRFLAMLDGEIDLKINEGSVKCLSIGSPPYRFLADQDVYATLKSETARDLNLMVRGTDINAQMTRQSLKPAEAFVASDKITLLFMLNPTTAIIEGQTYDLNLYDLIWLERDETMETPTQQLDIICCRLN